MKHAAAMLVTMLALAGCGGEEPAHDPVHLTSPTPTPTPGEATTPAPAATGDEAEVEIEDFTFQPGELTVAPGTTVVWKQRDDAPHTVTADDESFDSGTMQDRDEFTLTFDEPGTYPYHCHVHPSMTGTVTVA